MCSRPLFLCFALLLTGCATRSAGDPVRRIKFEVEGRTFKQQVLGPQSDRQLRSQMAQVDSSIPALLFPNALEPAWLDRSNLDDDALLLEVWLAERGYFDATFERWEVVYNGEQDGYRHSVTVIGHLAQKEPSLIRSVDISGIDGLPGELQRAVRGAELMVVDDSFSGPNFEATLTAQRNLLLEAGYAFAEVTGAVDAYPEELEVDVHIQVSPGVPSTFGPVTVLGIVDVPGDIVAEEVTFLQGDPFSPSALADTRATLFGLRAFSSVNVVPSFDDPVGGVVPVEIEVRNTKWRRIKAGPGVQLESGKSTVYGSVEWEHANLFKRLVYVKEGAKVGLAGVVTQDTTYDAFSWSQVEVAPVLDLTSAVSVPHVIGHSWSFDTDARLQVGVEPGYRFFSPEIAPGLTWHPRTQRGRDRLSLGLGYRVRYFDYFDLTMDLADITSSPLGLDLTDPYLLSMLYQRVVYDGRDNKMSPSRGWYGSAGVSEAGGPVFGNFNFIRILAEIRGYQAVPTLGGWNPRLVVAARVGGGVIMPYGGGPKASVPYAERLYLGGGTTVRGWGANRLGPSVTTTNTQTGETEIVPSGGLLDAYGNLELRKVLAGPLSLAAFTDVGRVWADIEDFTFGGLQWSVGGGLRYMTAIGPIRADVGFRLGPEDPELQQTPTWALHFGLAEAF